MQLLLWGSGLVTLFLHSAIVSQVTLKVMQQSFSGTQKSRAWKVKAVSSDCCSQFLKIIFYFHFFLTRNRFSALPFSLLLPQCRSL